MDKRISYKIVLDTETCPLDKECTEVKPENMFAYDIGWAIVDKRGKVYEQRSYINSDIFLHENALMNSAYYADKIPQYYKDLENGTRTLDTFFNIRQQLLADIKKYNVTQIFAHNMRFDYGVLNNTQRWLTKSKYRYFFPYGMEICDTMKMAQDVICKTPTYINFCKTNNFVTTRGVPRKTAEVLYRYITQNLDFVESHTGLEDVLIEKEIMAYCYKKHKKMRRLLWENT